MKRICRKKMEPERRSENEGGQIMTERERKTILLFAMTE
jgi:hypothetical protein